MTLIRLPQVVAICGISRSEIYRRMSEGRFPASIPLGGKIKAWSSEEISSWVAARIAERDEQRKVA